MLDTTHGFGTFHRDAAPVVERPATRPPEHAPPPAPPREEGAGRWPPRARAVIAVLAALALLAAFGLAVALLRTSAEEDTSSVERARDAALAQLGIAEQARDAALADLATAEQARDAALADLATAEQPGDDVLAEIATAEEARDAALADLATAEQARDAALADLATVTAERDALRDADSALRTLTAERDEALETVDELAVDLLAQTQRTNELRAERDALAARFPIELDAWAPGPELVGTYDVELTQVHCEGFASCALVPAITRVTITSTPEGWLELTIPGRFTMPLFRVNGALHGITESTSAAPACGTTPRRALVSVTAYPTVGTIDAAGGHTIDELGAGLTMRTAPTSSCGTGLAVYSARIVPS